MKPIWAILSTTLCTATLAAGLIAGFYFMAGLERQPASKLTAAPEPRPPVGRDIEHSALSTAATPSVEPFRPSLEAPSAAAANRYAVTADGDRHAPPPERWTPIKFEHEVPNALLGWLKEILGTDYPIVYTEAFKYAAVDLKVNDKYTQDIITYIEHPDFCGSDGCSIHIYKFDSNGDSYKAIGAFCSNGQVAFAGNVTTGYRDLINDKADFIVFDGTQYILSGLPPEPASRSADRHVPPPERCIGPDHAFSRNRHVPPPERWTPIKFEYGVPKVYVGWLKRILGRDFDSAYTKGFKYAAVNLKVDDKSDQDIITYIELPGFCGSGGCSIDINKFDPRRHSYKGIGSFFSNGQVAFAGTVTNGYRDLINDKADFIVFDGTQYVESGRPPEPAAAQGSPPGVAPAPAPPTQSASQAQVAQGCDADVHSGVDAWEKCAGAALRAAKRCETEMKVPDGPERYGNLADCEEAAAEKDPTAKANPKVAEELRLFARGHHQLAKPGALIGMTAEQVINDTSWGRPNHVNSTTTAAGEREQWLYPGQQYLSFENGRLVAVQTRQ